MTILVGDVGGTYTRLALFDNALVEPDVYPTSPSVSLEELPASVSLQLIAI